MKAKVIFLNSNEADVFMSDGGTATFHHNGDHMVTTYYQDRVVQEELEEGEDIWEKLGEGKVYCKDWEDKHVVDDEMIKDACFWLAPQFETTFTKVFDKLLNKVVVYDNGGETLDRYTVFTHDAVYGMSETGGGFNQYVGDPSEIEEGDHLGEKLDAIPEGILSAVIDRLLN